VPSVYFGSLLFVLLRNWMKTRRYWSDQNHWSVNNYNTHQNRVSIFELRFSNLSQGIDTANKNRFLCVTLIIFPSKRL
jgi:hypothetical protein